MFLARKQCLSGSNVTFITNGILIAVGLFSWHLGPVPAVTEKPGHFRLVCLLARLFGRVDPSTATCTSWSTLTFPLSLSLLPKLVSIAAFFSMHSSER